MSKFCLQCDDGTKLKLQTKNVTVEARGEPPMNHALIVNLLASLFSIAQTGGSVE